ncbi:hypothetical protein [Streptomyces marincola]|uniref:Uncharacterized protein n=1 Tax=Streptomyces marincola TaxID=2878388 RepID=A0A1W7CWL2_9ACTN|nr:hypothetical protein [Streptomyces marincola]ARQ69162.1 hypothetical protein CAG99_10070 [Streptomyces marincola]
MKGVVIAVEVDARSVAVGDQIMIGSQPFTVCDLITLEHGRKRVLFESGETLVMNRATVLWAARRHDPRIFRGRRR